MGPSGSRLKVPVWMLSSACADVEIDDKPFLSKDALLNLSLLLVVALTPADADHDNLLQMVVDRSNGGKVVQLQLLDLMIEKRDVRVPVDARVTLELIDPMASILVAVFEAQETGADESGFMQSQD